MNPGEFERAREGTADMPPGTVLADRYRIISTAGRGGMGLVYKVEQIFIRKILALKTIDQVNLSDMAVRRFQHEARATFAVSHANIVCVHDFGLLDEKTPFLVMDFIDGETLAQTIEHSGSGVPAEHAIAIFIQVCFGLAAAHDVGIVHRDLKPTNIIIVKDAVVGAEGSVKVVDFGIAKLLQHDGGELQALTRTGEICGSPLYMSPEQCKSGRVDHRSDVYSLGCVLFETLTGAPPFIGDSALTTMMMHQSEEPPTLKQASLGKEFPQALENILAKMLAKDPQARYQNLGVVAHALAGVYGQSASAMVVDSSPKSSDKKTVAPKTTVTMSQTKFVFLSVALAAVFSAIGFICGTHNTSFEHNTKAQSGQTTQVVPAPIDADTAIHANDAMLIKEGADVFTHDDVVSAVKHPTKKRELVLSMTVSRPAMKLIADTNWVTSAKLNCCHFNNKDFELLAKKPNLTSLFASDGNFNDEGALYIGDSPSLARVELARTKLTDKGVVHLARLKHLRDLQISETHIGAPGISALAKNATLDFLRVSYTPQLIDSDLADLSHSQLRGLDLSGDKQIGDGALVYLEKMPRLNFVNLEQTNVSASGIDHLLSNGHIDKIAISGAANITAEARERMEKKFPSVTFSHQMTREFR